MVSTVKAAATTIIIIFPSLSGVLLLIETLLWLLSELFNFVVWIFATVFSIVLTVGSCVVASLISVFVVVGVGVVDDAVERIVVLGNIVKLLNCVIGSRT